MEEHFDHDLNINLNDFEMLRDYRLALNAARIDKATRLKNYKVLVKCIWEYCWGALYANGYYISDKDELKLAVKAYEITGYEKFIEHSSQSKNKSLEVIANLICQAEHNGIKLNIHNPEIVVRAVRAYKMAHRQWTTGGFIGNIFFYWFFTLTSEDFRWFNQYKD